MKPERSVLGAIPRFSIDHPQAVMAVYLALLWLAWMSITQIIPRRFAPYVQSPLVGVVTMMPGLPSAEMETYVSKPIDVANTKWR